MARKRRMLVRGMRGWTCIRRCKNMRQWWKKANGTMGRRRAWSRRRRPRRRRRKANWKRGVDEVVAEQHQQDGKDEDEEVEGVEEEDEVDVEVWRWRSCSRRSGAARGSPPGHCSGESPFHVVPLFLYFPKCSQY